MKKQIFLLSFSLFVAFLSGQRAQAQTEVPKFEVGGQFSFIRFNYSPPDIFSGAKLDKMNFVGGGGRLTYNINKTYAIEGVVEGFSGAQKDLNPLFNGSSETVLPQPKLQGFFGVKAGVRRNKYGLFVKVRPGFTKYTKTLSCNGAFSCEEVKVTSFSLDTGGVIEGYLSKHFMVRADAGGTYLRYPSTTKTVGVDMRPALVFQQEGVNGLSLQISAGIGFRF